MHRPVLLTPASELPISVEEVARLLNKVVWNGDDMEVEDAENIEFAILSAIHHYEGWNGILGISLAVQEWRQDFDAFERELHLPLGPVLPNGMRVMDQNSIEVPLTDYVLRYDAGGCASIRLNANYFLPAGSASVTYQAGFSELPNDIKAAIVLRVQLLLDEAATGNSQYLERAEESLIAKYRRYQL